MKSPRLKKKKSRFLAAAWMFLIGGLHMPGVEVEAFGGSSSIISSSMKNKSSSSRGAKQIQLQTQIQLQLQLQLRRARGIVAPLKMSSSSSSSSNYSNNNNNDKNSDASYWKLPNDFYMFLNQRSIQSFMFLTHQLRDPETCYWVEDFTQPNLVQRSNSNSNSSEKKDSSLSYSMPLGDGDIATGKPDWNRPKEKGDDRAETEADKRTCHLLRYHGLAAMDTTLFPTWEAYFENLLEEPTDTWVIASDIPYIPDYTWEIDPTSLCSRILSVREQLSKEFAKDLQAVSDMGGQTFDWYWEKLRQSRDNDGNEHKHKYETTTNNNYNTQTPLITDPSSLRGSRDNLLFLEINVDDPRLDHKPSPLRRGNFDLLVLLATEEAIHRVLNRWESKRSEGDLIGSEHASHCFLEKFYQERQHFFHGPLPNYGKADDILEELLDSTLVFKAADNYPEEEDGSDASNAKANANASLVNPTKIAELVLKEREIVALDWIDIASEAPMHHMRIQKLRLDKMMTTTTTTNTAGGAPNTNAVETEGGFAETTQNGGFDPGPGAFE